MNEENQICITDNLEDEIVVSNHVLDPSLETETNQEDFQTLNGVRAYPSLYDGIATTVFAIMLGVGILGGIQWIIKKIFDRQKKEHKALTQFVTSMFALIVGIWIADKLIAGPDVDLLQENESRDILIFIKDTTLMVFAYYFGTKAQVPTDED